MVQNGGFEGQPGVRFHVRGSGQLQNQTSPVREKIRRQRGFLGHLTKVGLKSRNARVIFLACRMQSNVAEYHGRWHITLPM